MTETDVGRQDDFRARAITRLKKKRDFRAHLLVYVLVNSGLVMVWALTGHGFFWPAFVVAFWGVGVVMNAWDAYSAEDFSEEAIQHEMEQLRQH